MANYSNGDYGPKDLQENSEGIEGMQIDDKKIREDIEKQGIEISDREYGEFILFVRRKLKISGKGEEYMNLLMPDMVKEFCFRNAVNEMAMVMMEA